jgi:hypothetical protein
MQLIINKFYICINKIPPEDTNPKGGIFMKISIENDLLDIKSSLIRRGYSVFDLSEGVQSDVYIYSEKNIGLLNLYKNISSTEKGSLIINAQGKTNEEIIYTIENRVYTPLFNLL